MNKIIKLLEKPKVIVPVFAIIALAGSIYGYNKIGNPPQISSSLVPSSIENPTNPTVPSGSNISLSFAKGGAVEAVLVKTGDIVKSGEILARLSAPDAQGAVNQAKGALDLATAQLNSLSTDYSTTKSQQDQLVENAYRTLLSSGLEATPDTQDSNVPTISGSYTCDREGVYTLKAYHSSDSDSGYSLNYSGLESGTVGVKYDNAVPLGKCGLQIKFTAGNAINTNTVWTISIPNAKSENYVSNKNAYDLAVNTREKALADITTKLGQSGTGSVAKAQVDAAEGAYEAALGIYKNSLIISPFDGVVTFVDPNLKVGQSVAPAKPLISISVK